jgi:hypothetical protein
MVDSRATEVDPCRSPSPLARRAFLLAALALAALAAPAQARPPKKASLRQEVAQLRAQVTELRLRLGQLQGAVAAQGQRFAGDGGGVAPGPGGHGLCADPCATDSDGDGRGDCEDPCPCDAAQVDGDGTPDCLDPCPDDDTDACIDPCRFDSDGDGANDCEDPCPWDPAEPADEDENGILDCQDLCWLIMEPAEAKADGTTAPFPPPWCPIRVRPDGSPPAP